MLLITCASATAQEVYRWRDAQGHLHFGHEPPADVSAKPVAIEPNIVRFKATPPQHKQPSVRELPSLERPLATAPKSSASRKDDERICWLRYGMACQPLWHWKTRAARECIDAHELDCNSPIRRLEQRPASLLPRDLNQPFPRSGEVSPSDLACLLRSGFFCAELQDEPSCIKLYGLPCATLRSWAEPVNQRCRNDQGHDCSAEALSVERPMSFPERHFHKNRLDPILFDELRIQDDDPLHWPQARALLNQYPGD